MCNASVSFRRAGASEMKHSPRKLPVTVDCYPDWLTVEPLHLDINRRRLRICRLLVGGLMSILLLDPAARYFLLRPSVGFALIPVFIAVFFSRKSETSRLIIDRDGLELIGPRPVEKVLWRDIGEIRLSKLFSRIPVIDLRLRPPEGRKFDPSHDPDRFDVRLGLFGPGPSLAFLRFLKRARSIAAPEAGQISVTARPRTGEVTLRYPRRRMTGWVLAAIAATLAVLLPWSHDSWVAKPLVVLLSMWVDYRLLRRLIRPNAMHLGPDGFEIDYAPHLGIVEWCDTMPFTLRAPSQGSAVIGFNFALGSHRKSLHGLKSYPEDVLLPHFGLGSRAQFVEFLNTYRRSALSGTDIG